ncbi:M23 family metallopeptidase [Kribbella sp. NPDC023972]|uniref:M23 family metallopeptidase n=1 Tax=Kribbella sp. NPDC023972 TaxID=3154795 RepID=UPI0034074D8E
MAQPLPAGKLRVGTGWRYSKGGKHAAFDYPVVIGTPVFAVASGVVLDCNDGVTNRPKPGVVGAPSNWVLLGITHAGRKASVLYQHLSPGIDVRKGQRVKAGQKLGESGSSGNATGPHLHLAAMWGHRNRASRYDYLANIGAKEGPPKDGTAANEICIFPPSVVFTPVQGGGRIQPQKTVLAAGDVFVAKLRFGTKDSDSVRRLQFVLNGIKLVNGKTLKVTGNYDIDTKNEATKWQVQKDGCEPGTPAADGNIGLKQAQKLFGPKYRIK